jgi:DNA-binding IclR family transcriptional regulator
LAAVTPDTVIDPQRLRAVLESVRTRGYVVAQGTMSEVSTGIAVPVRDRGQVVAALSVVLPRESKRTGMAVDVLQGAATGISAALAAPPR